MGKSYEYDSDGIGVKGFYSTEIGNGMAVVVIIVYKKHPKCEHHFYRPGDEKGTFVQFIPDFHRPFVGVDLGRKGRARAATELKARFSAPAIVRGNNPEGEKVKSVIPFQTKPKVWQSGADRATSVFEN